MWVVKLGGSLFDSDALPAWLDALAGRAVIVPGGGPFADQVRAAQARWRFEDAVAHHMALLGMEQYGRMMTGLRSELVPADSVAAIRNTLDKGRAPVWTPAAMVTASDLKPSWSLTSDSLAAWLAGQLQAEHLLLVKSIRVDGAEVNAGVLERQGVVDAAFPTMIAEMDYKIWICGRDDYAAFTPALRGENWSGVCLLKDPAVRSG